LSRILLKLIKYTYHKFITTMLYNKNFLFDKNIINKNFIKNNHLMAIIIIN